MTVQDSRKNGHFSRVMDVTILPRPYFARWSGGRPANVKGRGHEWRHPRICGHDFKPPCPLGFTFARLLLLLMCYLLSFSCLGPAGCVWANLLFLFQLVLTACVLGWTPFDPAFRNSDCLASFVAMTRMIRDKEALFMVFLSCSLALSLLPAALSKAKLYRK